MQSLIRSLLLILGIILGITPLTVRGQVAETPKAEASGGAEAHRKAAVDAVSRLAADLYARLRTRNQGNLVFSPLNISTAMAMVYLGARGDTAAAMRKVLYSTLAPESIAVPYRSLMADLCPPTAGDYELDLANGFWGQIGHRFRPAYVRALEKNFNASLYPVDFRKDPETVRLKINVWTEECTHGKIRRLFPRDALTKETRLVLASALYFRGRWARAFDKRSTREGDFHLSDGTMASVRFMYQFGRFGYYEYPDVQILRLPYRGKISMLLVLSSRLGGLRALERSLTSELLTEWFDWATKELVRVRLPRCRITSTLALEGPLTAMGLGDMFREGAADLSGIDETKDLFLEAVRHQALVEVDEEGTEAAAVTGGYFGRVGGGPRVFTFRADRPFLFLIRDDASETILFLGRVMDPRG